MDFSLDSTQTELLDSLRRYLNAEVAPIVDRYEAEGHMVPQEMLRAMRDFGLLGGMLPERDGGYGLPATTYGMLIAEVARVWPALRSIVSTSNLAASVLTDGGSPELKEKYLPRILSGEAIASFALSRQHRLGRGQYRNPRRRDRHRLARQRPQALYQPGAGLRAGRGVRTDAAP